MFSTCLFNKLPWLDCFNFPLLEILFCLILPDFAQASQSSEDARNMLGGASQKTSGTRPCIIIDDGSDAESVVPANDSCGSKRMRRDCDQPDADPTIKNEGMEFMLQWLDDELACRDKRVESSTSTSSDLASWPKVCYVTGRNPPAWMMCEDHRDAHRDAQSVHEEPSQPLTDSQLIAMLDDDTVPANAAQNTRKAGASTSGSTTGVNESHMYRGHWLREHSHEELTDILHDKVMKCCT